LQDVVLDQHVSFKLAMVVVLGHSHILSRLGPRRGGLVHHLLRPVLRDEHDAMLAIVTDD